MSGLVGHWPLHEWTGRASDLSGQGNHGTVNGATRGVWGVGGLTAYSFDGTDDYVDTNYTWQISTGEVLFLSLWVRTVTTLSDGHEKFFGVFDTGDNSTLQLYFNEANGDLIGAAVDGTNSRNVSYSTSIRDGDWHHVGWLVDHDDDISKLYVDGTQVDSATGSVGTAPTDAFDAYIGAVRHSANDDSRHFDGDVADVRVYNRALSASEIQTLYEWGSGDYTDPSLHDGTDSGAVSRYEFTSGRLTVDSWGSNTLTDNTSAGWTTDAIRGDAKSVDGTDDRMECPDLGLGSGSSFTWSAWTQPGFADADNTGEEVLGRFDGTSDRMGILVGQNNNVAWSVGHNDGNLLQAITADGAVTKGDWYHITSVYDSGGPAVELYLNGILRDRTTGTVDDFATADGPWIGARTDSAAWHNGIIDDVRLYSRALAPEEVAQLYQWGTRGRDMRHRTVMG